MRLPSSLTLQDRVESFKSTFPQYPDAWPTVSPTGRWLTAMWMPGQDYRGTGYYGAYPPGYVSRVKALFPDVPPRLWLHLFSGSLRPEVEGLRLDLRAPGHGVVPPSVRANATQLPFVDECVALTAADPPYTKVDAKRYHTPPVNKPVVLRDLYRVTRPGGFLIWLDTTLPMYRKDQWHHWGAICVQRSTNHRTRFCSIFTRV